MRLFLDSTFVLAACGRSKGASRAIFDMASQNAWTLLASPYVLNEVSKNLFKLGTQATTDWAVLFPKLVVAKDVWTLDRPVVFEPAKDRPVLFTATAWATVFLTLDMGDFGKLMETGFYHLTVMSPATFLTRERAARRLRQ